MINHGHPLSTWIKLKVNSLLPAPRCPLCAEPSDMPGFCSSCRADLPPPATGCCRCADPNWTLANLPCTCCLDRGEVLDRTLPLFAYRFPVDGLIVRAKFRRQPFWLESLAWAGLERIPAALLSTLAGAVLIPVPLHRNRLSERGYNQAEVLARTLSRALSLPCRTDLVVRSQATAQQARLGAAARQQNLREAFRLIGMPPRHVILVDDVMTTGATLCSLAGTLRAAGTEEVSVIVLARASG